MRSLNQARICMTGTGGTGKSTVMDEIRRIVPFQALPSVSRGCHEKLGMTEADQFTASPERLWELQRAIFDAKDKLDDRANKSVTTLYGADRPEQVTGYVSDRSLVCSLAYTFQRSAPFMTDEIVKTWTERTYSDLRRFDVVAYFPYPPKFKTESGGFRVTTAGLLVAHDMLVCSILDNAIERKQLTRNPMPDLPLLIEVGPGTPTERAMEILSAVSDRLRRRG